MGVIIPVCINIAVPLFSSKKLGRNGSILPIGRRKSRIKQWRWVIHALPKCTLVSDQYDPSIGGAISDPV